MIRLIVEDIRAFGQVISRIRTSRNSKRKNCNGKYGWFDKEGEQVGLSPPIRVYYGRSHLSLG